jgi:hypothetical protein
MPGTPKDYSREIFSAEISGNKAEAARLQRLQDTRWTMSKHTENYQNAVTKLADGLAKTAGELTALEAERRKLPVAYYTEERGRLIEQARRLDVEGTRALTAYRDQAIAEAATLRSQAEADVPASERTALLLEQQTLTASKLDGDVFLRQAEDAIRAQRPRRAAMLVSVAESKGARGADFVRNLVEASLDVEDETRSAAADLEDSVTTNVAAYRTSRMQILRDSGLGMTQDGGVGTGGSSEVAQASVALKMEGATAAFGGAS